MSAPRTKKAKIIPLQNQLGPPTKKTPKAIGRKTTPTIVSDSAGASSSVSKVKPARTKKVAPQKPISVHSSSENENQEDEEDDLEEVPIPSAAGPSSSRGGTPATGGTATGYNTPGTVTTAPSMNDHYGAYGEEDEAEDQGTNDEGVIRLELDGETQEQRDKRKAMALRKKPITSKDRAIRLEAHKLHVVSLIVSARIRNTWCCNLLLKARLLSLLPHPLQAAFNIPPSRFPDRAQRSRLFFDALQSLVTWWSQSFFDISESTLGLRTRPWDEIQELVDQLPRLTRSDMFGSHFGETGMDYAEMHKKLEEGSGGERLRSCNSLMKKVLQQEGSRDVSAQLFVALARACGLGARLVTSLQPVPWRAEKVAVKKMSGSKGRTVASRQGNGADNDDSEEEEMEEVPIPGTPDGNGKAPVKGKGKKPTVRAAGQRRLQDPADLYRLRAPRPPTQKVGGPSKPKPKKKEDLTNQPPVFWAEVFSRSDQRWIPVDPVRGVIRKKTHYEPVSDTGPIRMLYVVAFEEDNYARDVTLRYAKNFGAKTVKLRVPQKKDEPDWWAQVMQILARPYRLNRDDLEDAELETSQVSEGMPAHMNGFKDHPIYVLERHLKREEVITPKKEIGRFRGEPVFRRHNVVACKTAETWMRIGRRVKDRQEPLKWVKQRAVTLQKRRAQELSMQESGESIQQGLYAEWQTEIYRPPAIKDGVIPQNAFGNIDLYAPTMLPAGAVHLPYKGITKVAKALGISYAEACTGFEFKKQRAIPVITGIVVAKENESLVMDAYEESAAAAEERERIKREEKALKKWAKLINGLRVRARLQAEYGTGEGLQAQQVNPLAEVPDVEGTTKTPKKTAASVIANATKEAGEAWTSAMRDETPSDDGGDAIEADSPETTTAATSPKVNADSGAEPPAVIENDFAAGHDSLQHADSDPEPDEDIEDTMATNDRLGAPPHPAETEGPVAASSGRPTRLKLTLSNKAADSPGPVGNGSLDDSVRPKRNTRKQAATKAKAPALRPATTRSLRSRAPKSEDKIKEEIEKRNRLKEALASDAEDEEDDEDM